MISIPVSVTTYNVEVSVVDDKAQVSVIPTVIEVSVSVNHGQSAAQVAASIAAACTKENITGLKKEDSPEFVDLTIPALNSTAEAGGEITPTLWAWAQSIGVVAKSTKSHIIGILTYLKSLAARVVLLEEPYLLKLILAEDVASINLTTDKYGNALSLDNFTLVVMANFSSAAGIHMRVNDRSDEIYLNFNLIPSQNRVYRNQFWLDSVTTYVEENLIVEGVIVGSELIIKSDWRGFTNSSTYPAGARGVSNTHGLSSEKITSINLFSYTGDNIKAGSIILLKRK